MKGLIILVFVIIVLGLYYAPKETKTVLHSTGNALNDGSKLVYGEFKESKEYHALKNDIPSQVGNIVS